MSTDNPNSKPEDILTYSGSLTLPAQLETGFWQEYRAFEEAKSMQYVTSAERFSIRQGLLKGISLGLKLKFGESGQNLLPEIESIQDVSVLEAITSRPSSGGTNRQTLSLLPRCPNRPT